MTEKEILKQYFGYDEFRNGQKEIIDAILHGKDTMGVMPTGAGKSLCYQIPAMLLPGVTVVISPLISLMRDQVQALTAMGISAAFINSSLDEIQLRQVISKTLNGCYKIIYIAPERLFTPSMLELASSLQISLLAVDESHCISQWGQDFRPSYLDIPKFIAKLPVRPVLAAFTATATPRVRSDILEALGLRTPLMLITGFDRPNLYFEVKQPADKFTALVQYLSENSGNGIVYCSTRKETDSVTESLIAKGYSAVRYHAGLSADERSRAQDDFLYDRIRIIVATNAFGMGIDKSNVRFVIHYNMPQNVESYYQEAGRAGRDGMPADCILFYARKDINTALFLIRKSENEDEIARNIKLLNQMERYCEIDGCLRRYMLEYFGEPIIDDCGNCGNCNGDFLETDITIDAQKMLSHIARLNDVGKRFMFTHTADIIQGKSADFTGLSTFGIMRGVTRNYIRRLTNRLEALGYIYNDGYLSVTDKAKEVLFNGATVTIRGGAPTASIKSERKSKHVQTCQHTFSDDLFSKLKELRLQISREEGVPAFVVFSDATLVDMCLKHPRTDDEMLSVSGVGEVKLARYGELFLALLREEEPGSQKHKESAEMTDNLFFELFTIDDNPLQISRVADNINAVLIRYDKPKTSGMKLNNLLLEAGYLEVTGGVKLPSDSGKRIGITTIQRNSNRSDYVQCLFGSEAQKICGELFLKNITLA